MIVARADAAALPPPHAESSELRQQIRWALFGFTGYALFLRCISIVAT